MNLKGMELTYLIIIGLILIISIITLLVAIMIHNRNAKMHYIISDDSLKFEKAYKLIQALSNTENDEHNINYKDIQEKVSKIHAVIMMFQFSELIEKHVTDKEEE